MLFFYFFYSFIRIGAVGVITFGLMLSRTPSKPTVQRFMLTSRWISIGSVLLSLAILLGAFGAHALKGKLDPYALSVYEKATFYHTVHGLAIIIVGILSAINILSKEASFRIGSIFLCGVIIFSGSLYALAITGIKVLGALTPIGGVLLIIGWVLLAVNTAN